MEPEGYSMLAGLTVLGLAAGGALYLTMHRKVVENYTVVYRSLIRVLGLTIALQGVHLVEEYSMAFYVHYPTLLGLAPWPGSWFLTFNLFWIVVWVVSAWGLRKPYHMAFFSVWFLAIAGVINGVAHPLLALYAGAYFPGLWTGPLMGVMGILLLRVLNQSTTR